MKKHFLVVAVLAWLSRVRKHFSVAPLFIALKQVKAEYKASSNKYIRARNLYFEILVEKERLYGTEHIAVAKTLLRLSELRLLAYDQRLLATTHKYLMRAFDITHNHFGLESKLMAKILHRLGDCNCLEEDYDAALEYYESAKDLYEQYNDYSFTHAELLDNLARIYHAQGEKDEAEKLRNQAQDIRDWNIRAYQNF